jgi:Ribonuclease III
MHDQQRLTNILIDGGLAQFGDALLNFAFSLALTKMHGNPTGTKIPDKVLADAAVKAGLRKFLPRRVGRGDVANGFEALLGHLWLEKLLTLDEIVECLKRESIDHSQNFVQLAELALERMKE